MKSTNVIAIFFIILSLVAISLNVYNIIVKDNIYLYSIGLVFGLIGFVTGVISLTVEKKIKLCL
ncbi:MAG: hypothetical protein RSE41_00280 [Clostridia bacterium]